MATNVLIRGGNDKNDVIDVEVSNLTLRHFSTEDGRRGIDANSNATGLVLNNLVITDTDSSGIEINVTRVR